MSKYLLFNRVSLQERRIKKIFKEILEGVLYLHSIGIIHRDLKPENIMISYDGDEPVPKIIDFGISVYAR